MSLVETLIFSRYLYWKQYSLTLKVVAVTSVIRTESKSTLRWVMSLGWTIL